MAKLGDYCIINPPKVCLADNAIISFIPMNAVSEDGDIDISALREYGEVKTGFSCFQDGDVLFAKITPCMENGKGAIAHNLQNGIGFGSTEFHVIRPDKELLDSKYLYYCTVWPKFRKDCERNMTGSAGQKRVPKKYLETYDINIPDLPTQRRIAATLDKVSEGIDLCRKMLADLDELVKARFVEMFGNIQTEDSLEHLCHFIDYRGKTPDKAESGLPFITAKNVRMHHMSFDTQEFISKETYDKVMTRGLPKVGDVVFTTEAPLGNVCRIPYIDTEFYIGQRIITMQTDIIEPAYLEYALASEDFKKEIAEKSSGSTVTGIRSKLLEKLTIPVPPRELQSQFAFFVLQIDKSKFTIQQQLAELETLKKSLMQEYFG